MPENIENLVKVVGRDGRAVAQVQAVVGWIASTDEGRAMLEKARQLRGQPLEIDTDDRGQMPQYHHRTHRITASPKAAGVLRLQGKDGGVITQNLERMIAYEIGVAAQKDTAWEDDLSAHKKDIILSIMPPIPYGDYQNEIRAAADNAERLRTLFGRIFDTHRRPNAIEVHRRIEEACGKDTLMQHYYRTVELPASRFENLLMSKYRGEPERVETMTGVIVYDERDVGAQRRRFIDANVRAILQTREEFADVEPTRRHGD